MRVLSISWELEGPGLERAELFSAESLASYDAVALDPADVPRLWRGRAQLEGDGTWRLYPGRDMGLSRALERLLGLRREELADLVQRGGGVLLVRVRAESDFVEIAGNPPRRITPYVLLPHLSLVSDPHHLSLPQGLRFIPRRGRDVVWVERFHPLSRLLQEFKGAGYEAVLASSLGAPLSAFGRVLARNRVGDVLAWDLPVGGGHIVFLPAFPGVDPGRFGALLVEGLAGLLDRPLPEAEPKWLSGYTLPGEDELRDKLAALRAERERLEEQETALVGELNRLSWLKGLIHPRGEAGLRRAVGMALEALGLSVAEEEGFVLARSRKGELLVRAALSLDGPVGPEPYRELLLTLDRLRNEEGRKAYGLLVAVAEPRLDPKRRGPQWTETVRRGCREHGIALVSGYQLFQALRAVLADEAQAADVRGALFEAEGEWRWRG